MKARLSPAQRYNRLWRKVKSGYAGMERPKVQFGKTVVKDTYGTTSFGKDGPTVHLSKGITKSLTSRDPYKRRMSRGVVLHEFAHAAGDHTEEGADATAARLSRRLNKQQRLRRKYLTKEP